MSQIQRLWADFRLPIRDALHFAEGDSYDVVLASDAPGGWKVLAPFDMSEILAREPDWTSSVDGLISVELGQGGSSGVAMGRTAQRDLLPAWPLIVR